ncbi:MAG: hypothetical protein WCS89_01015 [Candidatus Paceibacterota bacterium]
MKNKTTIPLIVCSMVFALFITISSVSAEERRVNKISSDDQEVENEIETRSASSTDNKKEIEEKKGELAEKKIERIKTAADKELEKRIEDLKKLQERIKEFKNLSDNDESFIASNVNELVAELNKLKNTIDTTNSTTTLKEARDSITSKYRVYALFMPKMNIIASADRITTMVSMMSIVSSKLEARLNSQATSSQITSANIASAREALVRFNSKVADAQIQAQGAITDVANLIPDQGDKGMMASTTKALQSARAKIKVAHGDLTSAKNEANTIIKLLTKGDKEREKLNINMGNNATSTPKSDSGKDSNKKSD